MAEPHVKGSIFIPGQKYMMKHYGKKGMEKIRAQMDPKDAAPLTERILAGKWYPFRTFVGLLRATDDVYGKGDNSSIVDMGVLGAKEGLSGVYKFFIRLGKPNQTLERTQNTWHLSFDSGRMEVLKNDEGHAIIRLSDWPEPRKEFCMAIVGWTRGALELAGSSDVTIKETRCACLGDKYCEWDIKWK